MKRFFSCSGSPVKQLYAPKVGSDGVIDLVEAGEENIKDYIQSFRDSCDLSVILARVARGETELLYQRPGSYGDFTKMPKTYAEMLQLQIDSKNLFNSLPVDVKDKFGHDSERFLAEAGTKDWFSKIEAVLPEEVKSAVMPKDEVKSDES